MKFLFSLITILFLSKVTIGQEKILNLIPYPLEVKQTPGSYLLKNKITVSSNLPSQDWSPLFSYFKAELKKQFGIEVSESEKGKQGDIDFFMIRMSTSGKPAYKLNVSQNGISIQSNFDEPAFHAMQTFIQLIPIDTKLKREIPFVEIFDYARFDYRGMHLDVCRHFFPVSFVKKYIDYLAYHKLNIFHWHLTEDQGWRIEIKKYPELTSIGSNRNGTIIGRYPGTGNDNIPYGGSYTQEDIKEVVQYAKERFIEVIPEIEMPGHGSAAIAAYPWLSCFPEKPTEIPKNMISQKSIDEQKNNRIKLVQETWGVFDDIFCAGKDSTFLFLQNVIDEVIPLFPSKYFHIGGDEAPKTHWEQCPQCQKRMKELGLKDEHELQSWFVQRIEKYLNSKGKTLIGWDEILEGGLAPNAVVMSWRGETGGIEAAKQKHYVIMTPGSPLYFDHTQSENEDSVTIGGYNPIEKVYAYEPASKELTEEEGKYILGAQANLWTEYIGNEKKVEYMIFPRMAALSEILWTQKEKRDWKSFEERLPAQMKRYEMWGANYSKAYFDLNTTVLPTEDFNGVIWKIQSKYARDICEYCHIQTSVEFVYQKDKIEYDTLDVVDTLDPSKIIGRKYVEHYKKAGDKGIRIGNMPWVNDTLVLLNISETSTVNASQRFHHGKGKEITQYFQFNKATGKKITLKEEATKNYPGDGAFTLVNGVINEKGFSRTKEFLGFSGIDCEAVIDLGSNQEISFVVVNTFSRTTSWIWQPQSAEAFGSIDGKTWHPLNMTKDFVASTTGNGKGTMTLSFKQTPVQYVKVLVKNWGVIPEGNAGAGNKAWLFVDEIEVE